LIHNRSLPRVRRPNEHNFRLLHSDDFGSDSIVNHSKKTAGSKPF
jgi:hypothetical protein